MVPIWRGHVISHQAQRQWMASGDGLFLLGRCRHRNGLMVRQQVLQWVRPYQGHFWMTDSCCCCCCCCCHLCGQCLALLGITMTAMMMTRWRQQGWMPGRQADKRWGRGIRTSACSGWYWRPRCLAPPFLLLVTTRQTQDQRAYAAHDRGEGLREEWRHSAGQQTHEVAIHQ